MKLYTLYTFLTHNRHHTSRQITFHFLNYNNHSPVSKTGKLHTSTRTAVHGVALLQNVAKFADLRGKTAGALLPLAVDTRIIQPQIEEN
jgi:hypothetical protein